MAAQIGKNLSYAPKLNVYLEKPQNLNRYAYALNNPLKYIDYNGLWSTIRLAPVHQTAIKNALSQHFSKRYINIIQNAQIDADAKEFQSLDKSFRHAMRSPDQTSEQARKAANVFVRKQFKLASIELKRGDLDSALNFFLLAFILCKIPLLQLIIIFKSGEAQRE